jgi:hypothetical protein
MSRKAFTFARDKPMSELSDVELIAIGHGVVIALADVLEGCELSAKDTEWVVAVCERSRLARAELLRRVQHEQ